MKSPRASSSRRAPREPAPFDARALTGQMVAVLRGRRSQRALSARLGYRVNVLSGWESGRRQPPAAEVLRLAQRVGIDVRGALVRFDDRLGAALGDLAPWTIEGVAVLVRTLIDEQTHAQLARALTTASSPVSRSTVARWASGRVAPRFSDLLGIVAACTHRLVDFVGVLVDPARLPSIAREHARIEAERQLLAEDPALAAVLPALTLRAYRALPAHVPGWIATRVGITRAQEERGIALLLAAGAIVRRGARFEVAHDRRVDVRADRSAALRLQRHWAHVAADQVGRRTSDLTRFHLVSVHEDDLAALRALLQALFERVDQRLAAVEDP